MRTGPIQAWPSGPGLERGPQCGHVVVRGHLAPGWSRSPVWTGGGLASLTWTCPTASVQKPSVFPLQSCCKSATSVTLGCLVMGYFPEPVTVTWDTGSLNASTLNFPTTQLSSGLLARTSQVTVSGTGEWARKSFTCSVGHAPSTHQANRTFRACLSSNFTGPDVTLFQSSCDPTGSRSFIQLYCLISGYTPGDLVVTWLKDGKPLSEVASSTAPPKQEGKLASTHSKINVTQEDWMSESTFSCQVSSHGLTSRADTQKCPDHEPRGISTYLIPPSPLDLYVRTAPKLTCLVVDLESKEGVEVVWTRDSQKPVSPDPWKATKQPNATFSITSTLPVDAKDWIDGETYRCMVKHPELPKPIIRTLAKAPGKRMVPKVHVFLPPEEPGSQDKLTLTCLVQNFFPMDISVQWLRNGQVHRDQQSTTAPLRTHTAHPAFFLFSRLEVARADWAPGNTFTCRVVHEALPGRRTLEETVSRSPGK
uniref:Immunoglobulin heavy constant epsilon n=1 Tax=Sciurus vulgaris TaxID=55149 RepID=A0A8D2B3T9_SCIVU